MTVYMVYFTFICFVLLLTLINAYFLISLTMEKRNQRQVEKKKEQVTKILVSFFENNEINREEVIKKLKSYLNWNIDIQAFHESVKEYQIQSEHKDELTQLLEEVIDIKKLVKSGAIREEHGTSYALYLMSEFGIEGKEVGDFALSSLNRNSLHVRNNALNVVSKNHNLGIVMEAMNQINKGEHYFNDKIVIDFLDSYRGNQEELAERLYEEMDTYNINLQKNIINHFNNTMNDEPKIRGKLLSFLQYDKDKELVIVSTRYFSKIIEPLAKSKIMANLASDDWEVRAISAKVIAQYPGEETIDQLRVTLTDENYYVRYNSAHSFLKLADNETVIEEALTNSDPFARGILLYLMNIEGIISIEKYEELFNQKQTVESIEGVVLI